MAASRKPLAASRSNEMTANRTPHAASRLINFPKFTSGETYTK